MVKSCGLLNITFAFIFCFHKIDWNCVSYFSTHARCKWNQSDYLIWLGTMFPFYFFRINFHRMNWTSLFGWYFAVNEKKNTHTHSQTHTHKCASASEIGNHNYLWCVCRIECRVGWLLVNGRTIRQSNAASGPFCIWIVTHTHTHI